MINPQLQAFIEAEILPLYDAHDKGHNRTHVNMVLQNSIELCADYEVDPNMVYTIAAYHDVGIRWGREHHHLTGAKFLRDDTRLCSFFTLEEIRCMSEAVEDHRASGKNEPRSIYGKIVSEADRVIDPELTIYRCIEYGKRNYPELDFPAQVVRTRLHLNEKYGENGYIKLWLNTERNLKGLLELRALLQDPEALKERCRKYY